LSLLPASIFHFRISQKYTLFLRQVRLFEFAVTTKGLSSLPQSDSIYATLFSTTKALHDTTQFHLTGSSHLCLNQVFCICDFAYYHKSSDWSRPNSIIRAYSL